MNDLALARVAREVDVVLRALLDQVQVWASQYVSSMLGQPKTAAASDHVVEWIVATELASEGPVLGAGFVPRPGLLEDAPWHLSWWLSPRNTVRSGPGPARLRQLKTDEDPASLHFHDYTRLEWWRVPLAEHRPHLTGPYVDYLCTEELTVTLTSPVIHEGEFWGIFGADLSVATLDALIAPAWGSVPGPPILLVNRDGRILASNSVAFEASALLPDAKVRRKLRDDWGAQGGELHPVTLTIGGLALLRFAPV